MGLSADRLPNMMQRQQWPGSRHLVAVTTGHEQNSSVGADTARVAGISLLDALYSNGHGTSSIENGNVTSNLAEDYDSGLRDPAIDVVDDEVIRTPQSKRTSQELKRPLTGWQG